MRSIPGLRNSVVGVLALCTALIFASGCALPWTSTVPANTAPVQQTFRADNAYITVEELGLRVHHFGVDTTEIIPATHPTQVIWSQDNNLIAWVEERESAYAIVVRDITTGSTTQPYISSGTITHCTFSPKANQLACIEDDALYIMTIHGEQVQRIAEHVVEYAWSPNNRTLAVSTKDQTMLATPSLQSNDIVYTTVRADQPLQGLAFRRADTLIGFVVGTGLSFVSYNTVSHETTVLTEWSQDETATDRTLPLSVQSFMSPDASLAIIEETSATGRHNVSQYTFATDVRVTGELESRMQGWYSMRQPIVLQNFQLVVKNSILQDESVLSLTTAVQAPVAVRSYYTP